jgi:hypothetical protein
LRRRQQILIQIAARLFRLFLVLISVSLFRLYRLESKY